MRKLENTILSNLNFQVVDGRVFLKRRELKGVNIYGKVGDKESSVTFSTAIN